MRLYGVCLKKYKLKMILYPELLATMVLAGGPAATSESKKWENKLKRSIPALTEYVAITSYPNGEGYPYCLRNVGASMVGLQMCFGSILTDAMSLFTFEPTPGYSKGDGNYTMKSAYNGLCKSLV